METDHRPVTERTHPVHRFAGAALAALDRVGESPAWAMTPAEQAEALVELSRLEARLTELRWRVLVAADRNEIGAKDGSASTAAWLSRRTRENRTRTNGDLQAARALDEPRFAVTRTAFAAGRLTEAQVWVIVRAIEDLPVGEVTEEERARAQGHLVALAAEHDAKQLQAQMLGKAVQAFAAPRRQQPGAWVDAEGRKRPYAALLGQSFADLVEHLPTSALPQSGGTAATVVVTMDLDQLRQGLGAASLDTGGMISASEVRRLACNSGLVPAVLGSRSVPLDLGRTVRLHTGPQRTAMGIRDKGCTAQGCDRPPAWAEAHHEIPWAHGGRTSVAHGRLLCPHHHHLAHDSRYDMRRLPDGKVRFARPT